MTLADRGRAPWAGLAIALLVTLAAHGLHGLAIPPFTMTIGGALRHPVSVEMLAILLGIAARSVLPMPSSLPHATRLLLRYGLPLCTALLGASLNLTDVAGIGLRSLAIVVASAGLGLLAALLLARPLGVSAGTSLLIGAGTAICGNSAILAVAPFSKARDDEFALAVGTINLMGLSVMFALPLLGGAFGMTDAHFGIWAGATVHAIPQAAATGFAFSAAAGKLATLAKLVRVSMLPLLVFGIAVWARNREARTPNTNSGKQPHYLRLLPWSLWLFMALTVLNTLGLLPILEFRAAEFLPGGGGAQRFALASSLTDLGKLLLPVMLAAIGLELRISTLLHVGARAMALGAAASVILCAGTLGLIIWLL